MAQPVGDLVVNIDADSAKFQEQVTFVRRQMGEIGQSSDEAAADVVKDLNRQELAAKSAGISVGQYKAALRMLPAQFTDIATQLAGGQNPFLIMLQQGGQISDSFGGLGALLSLIRHELSGVSEAGEESSDSLSENANALSENAENAKKLFGFITPARLAIAGTAAAVATLAYAYYRGAQEQDNFNKSLILTGNMVGKTTGQLSEMSRQVSSAAGSTVAEAADVLNLLVSEGKVAGDSLHVVATAVLNMSDASGEATKELIADFNAIGTNPVEAVKKLNDQYNFLTLATYNQIKALQEEGNMQEAARIATEAYADSVNRKAAELQDSLGALEKIWKSIGDTAKGAWDAMLDVGRGATPEERLTRVTKNLADTQKRMSEGGIWNRLVANASGFNIDSMRQKANILSSALTFQHDINSARAAESKHQKELIALQAQSDSQGKSLLSNAQRRTAEINKASNYLKEGLINQEEYDRRVSEINDRYKDPKQPRGKEYSDDAARRLLDQINQQTAALREQLDASGTLNSVVQERIKFEQQIADLQKRQAAGQSVTKEQQSLLVSSDQILLAYKEQEALSEQVKTLDEFRKMQDDIRSKDEKHLDLTKKRLELLEKVKAAGNVTPENYASTSSDIAGESLTDMPKDVKRSMRKSGEFGGGLYGTFDGAQSQMDQLSQQSKELEQWYQSNLDSLSQYRQQRADLNAQWDAQEQALRKQHAQAEQNIELQKNAIVTNAIQSGLGSMVDITRTAFGEKSAIYKATFIADKAYAIAQATLAIQTGIAQAAANPFPYNLVAMASVAAATASIVSSIQSVAMVGMAHDGLNTVPETGTWLLQKGERVTTANTSAKLDKTLDDVQKRNEENRTATISGGINQTFQVNGNPDDRTILLMQNAAKQGAQQGYQMVVNHLTSGQGLVSKALGSGWTTGRRKR